MTEEEKDLTNRYGITVEQKNVYHYKGHKYDRLQDALNYAKAGRDQIAGSTRNSE